jgi:hypothetical protein
MVGFYMSLAQFLHWMIELDVGCDIGELIAITFDYSGPSETKFAEIIAKMAAVYNIPHKGSIQSPEKIDNLYAQKLSKYCEISIPNHDVYHFTHSEFYRNMKSIGDQIVEGDMCGNCDDLIGLVHFVGDHIVIAQDTTGVKFTKLKAKLQALCDYPFLPTREMVVETEQKQAVQSIKDRDHKYFCEQLALAQKMVKKYTKLVGGDFISSPENESECEEDSEHTSEQEDETGSDNDSEYDHKDDHVVETKSKPVVVPKTPPKLSK